ncbi:hypothetical protein Poli38472_011827 [Pythium oligandrum]|uniref:Uncharacterized protein n=1 Tax=Pythium oligandrum TaxID=41045 RepID=A0A8K1C7T1_PYTOL|nr:hypothetical protein Poli38472_011827 [Pythium oligandrum]|eukprot:TMW58239.1 hypothetical protein Poli38472_011827 [Pythium oligandrum]
MSKWQPFKPFKYADLLPPQLRQKLRELLVFTEATGSSQPGQIPTAEQKYRYPSPTSQPGSAHVPSSDGKERVYNIQYYTRDIRRMPFPTEVGMHPSLGYVEPAKLPEGVSRGSPGNKNPAVLAYDPTGTRSAMSTTHEARDKLIIQNMSTHNVRMAWEAQEEEILKECEAKGIPPVPGRPFEWDMPDVARVNRW